VVNLGETTVPLPPHSKVLRSSVPLTGAGLPPDTSVWLEE